MPAGSESLWDKIKKEVSVDVSKKLVWGAITLFGALVFAAFLSWRQVMRTVGLHEERLSDLEELLDAENTTAGQVEFHEERLTDVECLIYKDAYITWADECLAKRGKLNEFFVCFPASGRPESFQSPLPDASSECKDSLMPRP